MQELQPAVRFAQDGVKQAEEAKIKAESSAIANNAFKQISAMPHFQEHKKEIAELMAQVTPEQRRQMGGSIALMYAAYNKVLADKVFPTMRSKVEQEVIGGFKKAASAGGAVSPSPAIQSKPAVREGNVDDLAKLMAAKAAALTTR